MKIKTNLRAGQGGSSSSTDTSTTSGQTQNQNGKGGVNGGGSTPVYYPPVSRCVGL